MKQSVDFCEPDESREAESLEDTGEQSGSRPGEEEETRGGTSEWEKNRGSIETGCAIGDLRMGSTDSASSAHSGSSACGLVSSLFPNSCRGRAESFARRLHRRLTSLGGEGSSSEDGGRTSVSRSTETSWLHAPTGQRTATSAPSNSATSLSSEERIFECQPRHSPESDIFYDLDLEPVENGSEGTVSPAEMANAAELAKILVNPRILKSNHHESCHCSPGPRPPDFSQDSECGYVFSSPLAGLSPDTDTSEAYFDPESSGTEKSQAETYFDPGGSSESEATSNFTNGQVAPKCAKISGRRRAGKCGNDAEIVENHRDEDSETSSSSCNLATLEGARPTGIKNVVVCSSEESLNGRSSLETTSPSHESLWSTFDESTVSLQDESPSAIDRNPEAHPVRLGKSHSDSEIIASKAANLVGLDEVDFANNHQKPETNGENDAEEFPVTCCPQIEDKTELSPQEMEISSYVVSVEIPAAFVVECPSENALAAGKSEPEESATNETSLRIGDSYGNAEMSRLVERLARSPNVEGIADGDEEEDEENEEDDEEEEDERPQRVRRCSSLKTGKTPPGTPGRKKIVRFADVLGLDLVDVRTFLDEIPKVPNSAYSDLIYDEAFQKDSSPVNFWGTGPATFTTPLFAATMAPKSASLTGMKLDRILVPLFQQPGGLPNFLDLVRERQVCLENVVVQDPVTICLQGTVRVRNLDFHKSVHVRYSLDSWRNFSDLQANYATNSCDGFSDKFTFSLYCHTLKVGQRLELAVRFQCKGTQYWDNNAGINYCFQCLPANTANPPTYIPITQTSTGNPGTHEWSPTFY